MQNIVYTKAATARLLNVNPRNIYRLEVWATVVYVHGKGISKFVSKKAYHQDFVDFRKASSYALTATVHPYGGYTVSGGKDDHHVTDELQCDCKDSYAQKLAFGRAGACKHVYAVLNGLGFSSLSEYVRFSDEIYAVR